MWLAINAGTYMVHCVLANAYYRTSRIGLQAAAIVAVKAGAGYLPADPPAAMRVADASAKLNGVAPDEIVLTRVGPGNHTLTIVLKRKLPIYMTLLVFGLPSREIAVSASAQVHLGPDAPGLTGPISL
jgi:hypothetical protein